MPSRGCANTSPRAPTSFSEASAVVCYLFPGAMTRLAPRLSTELAPGTRILSHTFALRGWKPLRTLVVDDLYRTPIYLYEVPARTDGPEPPSTGPGR
jgi:hypothetical protein